MFITKKEESDIILFLSLHLRGNSHYTSKNLYKEYLFFCTENFKRPVLLYSTFIRVLCSYFNESLVSEVSFSTGYIPNKPAKELKRIREKMASERITKLLAYLDERDDLASESENEASVSN